MSTPYGTLYVTYFLYWVLQQHRDAGNTASTCVDRRDLLDDVVVQDTNRRPAFRRRPSR